MATTKYSELLETLTHLKASEMGSKPMLNDYANASARCSIWHSNLPEEQCTSLYEAVKASKGNGIDAAIALLKQYMAEQTAQPFNLANLANLGNLVSDGAIFSVEFIKRSNGELRKMVCRMGVKKHLKGGKKAYSTKARNLLTVFDMQAKGYRSIPVDAIQRLSMNGQTFNFAGV
jgi:hypothetical protein